MDLKNIIRNVPDFPEKGIMFRDITPILHNPDCLRFAIDEMANRVSKIQFDLIAGPESRGFIFGVPLSYNLNKGFVPVRKAGKLPSLTVSKTYTLEYGTATVEMHKDAIEKGQKIIIVDDLLATGGTCKAIAELIEQMGGIVTAMVFLVELEPLRGRDALKDYTIHSVIQY